MKIITLFYILNATLLLLHEIESAYEKEWEILKLPGGITGFLLFHVPVLLIILYGLIEIEKASAVGLIIGLVLGAGGVCPFLVHKVIVKRKGRFALPISQAMIYLNVVAGIVLLYLSARYYFS